MAYSDRTVDFRDAIRLKRSALPESMRRKTARKSHGEPEQPLGKEYITEAYTVLTHIMTLTRMLAQIRKPYLSVETRYVTSRQGSRKLDIADSDQSWAGIRHLSNEERDQIDLQARIILTRCADRVKELETLEQRRIELLKSKVNPLARFLPSRLRQDESSISADFLAAHRSSVTWYLNRRLTEASQSQKELQEERLKRQLERTQTLGSGATREALSMNAQGPSAATDHSGGSWLNVGPPNLLAATIGATSSNHSNIPDTKYVENSDDDDDDIELSASQIQQFETENALILRNVQDTLESVQRAESRLLDISELQMELVTHLTRQTELTDRLYEDAITTTSTVEKGNAQLREAKRRAKDGRLFILLFLMGASLSLLFLHYY